MPVVDEPFVAVSRFTVRNGMAAEVRRAFVERPRRVDEEPGFLRMEVLIADADPDEFWLLTWWTDEDSFRRWHRGHTFKSSHVGIPAGLKLVPRSAELRTFRRICQ